MEPSAAHRLYPILGNIVLLDLIDDTPTLLSLCLVSKSFNAIFSPKIYTHIHLNDMPYARFRSLARSPGCALEKTQTLFIGDDIEMSHDESLDYDDHAESVLKLLQKVPNMTSFQMHGPGLMHCMTLSDEEDDEDESFIPRTLLQLAQCPHLTSLVLDFGDDMDKAEEFSELPPFQNLVKLHLGGLVQGRDEYYMDDVADILVASPGLRELRLAENKYAPSYNLGLWRLCCAYHGKTQSRLRLASLQLDHGFLPTWNQHQRYLSQLTHLDHLETLQIDNASLEWYHARSSARRIDPLLFNQLPKLRRLIVQVHSLDIQRLLSQLCSPLELHITDYTGTLPWSDKDDEDMLNENVHVDRLYSVPVTRAGTQWVKVCIGTNWKDYHGTPERRLRYERELIQAFVGCENLEHLEVPCSKEELVTELLASRGSKLHTLILAGKQSLRPLQIMP